jgi:hypothetical protein
VALKTQATSAAQSRPNTTRVSCFKFIDFLAAKAIESKNPKFMSTIEEYSTGYNNMLSASAISTGQRKLISSVSQAQLEMVHIKPKV